MPSNHLFIFLLLILNINSFLIGYLAGRQRNHNVSLENSDYKIFRNKKQQLEKSQISIDDKKFVVDINTANLEKKYSNLGEATQSSDNISGSVNKLKNIKG